MNSHYLACPLCSFVPPPGMVLTPAQSNAAFPRPWIGRGRRSGRFFFHRAQGCSHGPAPETSLETELEFAPAWNAWAIAETSRKADWLDLAPVRRASFAVHVGTASAIKSGG